MKILTKYNRVNIVVAFIVLLATSITYYYIIRQILLQQLDKDLKVEEQEIFAFVKENNQLPNATNYKGQEIFFEKATTGLITRSIRSNTKLNPDANDEEPVRVLTFPVIVHNVLYKASVIKLQGEAEDLLQLIVQITGGIFLFLLVVTLVINRFVLNKLWQPFYTTLQQLSDFNLVNARPLNLPSTNLTEFAKLNASVSNMASRVSNEFESLKAFTDNASHEMQTPLAIINSKLDLLLQTSTQEQAEQLQAIYNATTRLSKLNQTLLLLAKIDNEQYKSKEAVDLKILIEQKFKQLDELIQARNITLTLTLESVHISVNKELADVLLNNLVSNAIKHNYNGGYIECILTPQKLTLVNNGPALSFDENRIFKRFQKSDDSAGMGLGLAVVRQICDLYNLRISYTPEGSKHSFIILF